MKLPCVKFNLVSMVAILLMVAIAVVSFGSCPNKVLSAGYNGIEIVSMRTETSKTYSLGYKQYRTIIYTGAIHYKDNYSDFNEQWKDIDLTWQNNQITKAPYILVFNPDLYSLSMFDKKTHSTVNLVLSVIGNEPAKKVSKLESKGKLSFVNVVTDTDIEIVAGNDKVQFKRILKSDKAPSDATFAIYQSGNGILVTSEARYADSKGMVNPAIPVVVEKNGSLITEKIDKAKLVKYPIEVDPTLTLQPSDKDNFIMDSTPNTNYGDWTYLAVEYSNTVKLRSLLGFDISTLPATATITDATLNLYYYGAGIGTPEGRTYTCYRVLRRDWVELESTWNIYKAANSWTTAGCGSDGNDYTSDNGTTAVCPAIGNWHIWDVENQVNQAFLNGWTADFRIYDANDGGANRHMALWYSNDYVADTSLCPKVIIDYTMPVPAVTTNAATNVEDTTATLNGNVTAVNDTNIVERGFVWDTATHGDPGDVDPDTPTAYPNYWTEVGAWGVGAFSYSGGTFPTGTTIYYRACALNDAGHWGYGGEVTFLTKPAAPTNVSATDGAHTDKVVVTWTKSFGATDYQVYRDGAGLGWLGDVATYDDNGADAPTITAGVATASDGTSTTHVTLTIIACSANNGTTHTYKVRAKNATGESDDSATDTGYRGVGALTYEWFRSAADADAGFGSIAGEGGTTNPYNDPNGVVDPDGRWYYCALSATGAANQDTNHDRGYIASPPTVTTAFCSGFTKYEAVANGILSATGSMPPVIAYGFDYGLTAGYGNSSHVAGTLNVGDTFWVNLTNLTPATVYHYRAKVLTGAGWGYGSDAVFSTEGSPVLYEYLNTGQDDDSIRICSDNWTAMQFTVGNITHTATSINLYLKRFGNPSTTTISIKHASGGLPTGNDLVSTTFDADSLSTSYTMYPFAIDETVLEADQQYAIVIRALGGDLTNYVMWGVDSGGGLADAVYSYSLNGGLTYTSGTPADALFEIWGNPAIDVVSAKVFTGYRETGDWLIVCDTFNVYEPYYPDSDPQVNFQLQLIETATIKGVMNCRDWERQPLSIYLNAASAAGLTWSDNATYKLRIQLLEDAGVYQEYALLDDDWQAGSLYFLDGYVRTLASIYETYYGVDFLVLTSDRGKVLNEHGGAVFDRGIPYLSAIRPTLFETAFESLSHDAKSFTKAGETSVIWGDRTGAQVESFLNNFGNVMGMGATSGKDIGGLVLLTCWVGCALSLGTGHFGGGAIAGIVFVGAAMLFGLVPWAIVIGTAALGVIFIMMWFFLRAEG